MIPLHKPWFDDAEEAAILRVLRNGQVAGNGRECAALEGELRERLGVESVVAVSSATHALELSMMLLGVEGREVIVPSFTFPSVGSAILRAGGFIRFCEVREPDLNIDLDHARSLIGPKTAALVITHYAGHGIEADDVRVPIVEDAAHALGARVGNRWCGAMYDFGCFSFHATKNLVAGEGGALVTKSRDAARQARIFREKGTNREDFAAGRVDHYSWVGLGSSLVMPELAAALARVQMSKFDRILTERRRVVRLYDEELARFEREGRLRVVRPVGTVESCHHIYAVLVDPAERGALIARMAEQGVQVASHFVPLHASPYGRAVSDTPPLPTTDRVAASIVRLPLYPGLTDAEARHVVSALGTALARAA